MVVSPTKCIWNHSHRQQTIIAVIISCEINSNINRDIYALYYYEDSVLYFTNSYIKVSEMLRVNRFRGVCLIIYFIVLLLY